MTGSINLNQNASIAFTTTSVSFPPPSSRTATDEVTERIDAAATRSIPHTEPETVRNLAPGNAEILPTKPPETAFHQAHVASEVPGPVKGVAMAGLTPLGCGHIDEVLFAKQTEKGQPQRSFSQKFSENPLFPFTNGKYIMNVIKGLGKYGMLFTVIDGLKPSIRRALPDTTPCKEVAAVAITAALGGLAETLVTSPLSVCLAAKKTDNNQGKPVRTCTEIIRGVEPRNLISHFWPKEALKWNLARNVLFAVPLFTFIDPAKARIESALGYSNVERPSRGAQMGIDMAAFGVVSSLSSACSFWTDTIATRCTQTPGLIGRKEIEMLLKKEGLFGTVRQLNNGLPNVFIRMGIMGAMMGGVTAGLGIAYEPTIESFRQGLEGTRTSLAAFNPRTDLIADSPAEARLLGGGKPEEERPSTSIADFVAESASEALALGGQAAPDKGQSGFFSSIGSFLSDFLKRSSTAASSQALLGELPDEIEWTSSGDDEVLAPSPVASSPIAETPTVPADTDEGLLFIDGWVPPTGNRASEEASTQSTPPPAADEHQASRGGSWIDYASGPSFL
ncbi:MAG: hypothetical protein NTX49_08250 [Chlamydiae bacterium]|nr:hypothetical protein [Chlamydiota bacterium]